MRVPRPTLFAFIVTTVQIKLEFITRARLECSSCEPTPKPVGRRQFCNSCSREKIGRRLSEAEVADWRRRKSDVRGQEADRTRSIVGCLLNWRRGKFCIRMDHFNCPSLYIHKTRARASELRKKTSGKFSSKNSRRRTRSESKISTRSCSGSQIGVRLVRATS